MPKERLPSWENVARRLAHRMSNHAFCDNHPESAPEPNCPYCEDRATYRLWQRKAKEIQS